VPAEDVRSYWAVHLTSLFAHVHPEVIVVELGYNDCNSDLSTYDATLDAFMTRVPSGTPVHWLTMHDAFNARTCDETINAALTAATGRWSNLTLLDFAGFMAGHRGWCDDGVHLTDAGQAGYAAWLHQQLDAIYAPA
jgi:lysophospholipase L1-like esterase